MKTRITPRGKIGECSTADITFQDCEKLNEGNTPELLYQNEYGYVLYCNLEASKKEKKDILKSMKRDGFSRKFRKAYKAAIAQGILYLVIDEAAQAGRNKPDPSWDTATNRVFQLKTSCDIHPSVKCLPKAALEEITTQVLRGLYQQDTTETSGIEIPLDPKKELHGENLRSYIEEVLEKHNIQIA